MAAIDYSRLPKTKVKLKVYGGQNAPESDEDFFPGPTKVKYTPPNKKDGEVDDDYLIPSLLAVGGGGYLLGKGLGENKGSPSRLKIKPSNPGLEKAREALREYDASKFDEPGYKLSAAELEHGKEIQRMRRELIEYKMNPSKQFQASGIEMHGRRVGDSFIKSFYGDNPAFPDRKNYNEHMIYLGRNQNRPDIRKNAQNRLIVHEALGDVSPDTYYYRKNRGPITMIQERVHPMDSLAPNQDLSKFDVLSGVERYKLERKALEKGIHVSDLHGGNIGITAKGNRPVILDPGFERAADYGKLIRGARLSRMQRLKNIGSKFNRSLLSKMAKEAGTRLPSILGALGVAGSVYSAIRSNDAAAAVVDIADPTGLLSPSELGSGELPPEEIAAREKYNKLIKGR